VTVGVVEFERFGRDHGAQRVPLATRRVHTRSHMTSWDLLYISAFDDSH
jgi:hypothetical protein